MHHGTYSKLGPSGPPSAGAVAISLRPGTPSSPVQEDRIVQRVKLAVEALLQQLHKVSIGAVETIHRPSSGAAGRVILSLWVARGSSDPGASLVGVAVGVVATSGVLLAPAAGACSAGVATAVGWLAWWPPRSARVRPVAVPPSATVPATAAAIQRRRVMGTRRRGSERRSIHDSATVSATAIPVARLSGQCSSLASTATIGQP